MARKKQQKKTRAKKNSIKVRAGIPTSTAALVITMNNARTRNKITSLYFTLLLLYLPYSKFCQVKSQTSREVMTAVTYYPLEVQVGRATMHPSSSHCIMLHSTSAATAATAMLSSTITHSFRRCNTSVHHTHITTTNTTFVDIKV
jgi:hypothetical protein